MSEIIKSIEEVTDYKTYNGWTYEGYVVKTENKEYFLLIQDSVSCCENFGHICSADSKEELQSFIGSELLKIELVNTKHEKVELKQYTSEDEYEFVNLETNKGTLQLAVYNSHNGYYGHTVLIKVSDTVEERRL